MMRGIVLFGTILLVMMIGVPYAYATVMPFSESHIYGNTLSVIVNSSNPVVISDETPDYDSVEDTITIGQTEYEGIRIVNTENENNGIADADGNVNVEFTMNNNRPFCIAIHHIDGENSKLKIDITIDGDTKHYTSNISGYVIQYLGHNNKYFSLNTLRNNEDWIQTTSPITVEITNYAGHVPDNVTLSILFLD